MFLFAAFVLWFIDLFFCKEPSNCFRPPKLKKTLRSIRGEIQTQIQTHRNVFVPSVNKQTALRGKSGPETLFEAREVAGSAT